MFINSCKKVNLWKISAKDVAADVSSLFNPYEECMNNQFYKNLYPFNNSKSC